MTHTFTPLYERIVSEEMQELREYVRIIESQSHCLVDLEQLQVDLESRIEVELVRSRKLERSLAQHERKWRLMFKNLVDEKEHVEKLAREEKAKVDKLMEMVNRLQTEIHALIKSKVQQHNQHGSGSIHHHHQQQQEQHHQQQQPLHYPRSVLTDRNSRHNHLNGNLNPTATIASASTTNNSGIRLSSSVVQQHHQTQTNNINGIDRSGGGGGGGGYRKDRGNMIGPHEILAYSGSEETIRESNALRLLLDFFGL
ncbi:hypothetical protein ACHAXA_003805 [Cyclostephanos tholiformis]|uniref:Uncharacterized protein n=1 Tax=Cyclostephanos tholiformis TaxID=382380 RepID=A0ABD3RWJ4_9STRA